MKSLHVAWLLVSLVACPAIAADVESQVLAKEKSLWEAWKNKDGEAFRKSVTADSVQIIADGAPVFGRDAIVKAMTAQNCTLRSFSLADEQAHRLAPTVVMVTYTATQDGTCDGAALTPKLHSMSIYVLQKGKWLERYYQETPVK